MVKHLLSVNPEEALASRILEDFQTYMRGFVSLPINLPGTAYAKAVKVPINVYVSAAAQHCCGYMHISNMCKKILYFDCFTKEPYSFYCDLHSIHQARARLSSSVKEIMEGRRKRRSRELEELGEGEGDFLDAILSKQSLNDDEIVSIVLDIMLGGYETTSTLMALIVYFLQHSPIALAKLKVT